MNPLTIKQDELQDYLNKKEIPQETIDQIQKDFGSFGEAILSKLSAETDYKTIHSSVSIVVTELMEHNRQALQSIFYRMDLSESVLKSLDPDSNRYLNNLVDALIIRALKKVLTRKFYKNNG